MGAFAQLGLALMADAVLARFSAERKVLMWDADLKYGSALGQLLRSLGEGMRMNKRLPLLAFVVMLALTMISCSEPLRGTPTQDVATEDEVAQEDAAAGGVRVSCIDVGKGDCILVQAGQKAVLIDTGYEDTGNEVLTYLGNQGVQRLDVLILTHYDKDHIGGPRPIAGVVTVDQVLLPGYVGADKNYKTTVAAVDDLGLAVQPVTEELTIALGEARMSVYPPGVAYVSDAHGDEGNDNDASLVVALRCGNDSYLFVGDLEEEGIDAYLAAGLGHFDVLKMPHHGEKASNIDELLDDVQPEIALITDGADDPADKKTLKALKKHDVDTYQTSVDGTIVVESDGTGSYEVTTDSD
jgi:beta-lactamase superfamily II metal-dependent hydrolase